MSIHLPNDRLHLSSLRMVWARTRPMSLGLNDALRHPSINPFGTKASDQAERGRGGLLELQRGFTLLETLVVLGLVSILATLALVGIQQAREASRRMQCSSNLRQVGIALAAYHDLHNVLPPAVVWSPPGEPLGRGRLPIGVIDRVARYGEIESDTIYGNWVMMILPHLEQLGVYRRFNFSRPVSHPDNAMARAAEVAVLKCTSDSYNDVDNHFARGLAAGLTENLYARGNYALNCGPDGNCAGMGTKDQPCINGFFVHGTDLLKNNDQVWGSGLGGVNKSFNYSDVIDGLSNTIVVDEIRAGLDPLDPRGVWALGQVGSSMIARHGTYAKSGRPNPCDHSGEEFIGCDALTRKLNGSELSTECMACLTGYAGSEYNVEIGARSRHAGGINVLSADGASYFLLNGIDSRVWQALHTRNGVEPAEWPF